MLSEGKKRLAYVFLLCMVLGVEIWIACAVKDGFVRYYLGDVLVVFVLYNLVRIGIPSKCRLLPFWIFLLSVGVEVLQYFRFVELLGLEKSGLIGIIFGSVFDGKDILCYGIGCLILGIYEIVRYHYEKRKNQQDRR